MSNITLFGGDNKVALKGTKAMAAALKQASSEGAGSQLPEGGVYVSFSGKMGRYTIGEDKTDADPNELWLINVFSFEAGWICWKGGSPAAKRMGSIFETPIPTPDMAEHGPFNEARGEGWFRAKAFMMRSLDEGRQGYFSTNTKSAVREFAKLEGEVARRLDEGLPCWPVVQLEKESFTAQGQKNWKPVLHVAGWLYMKQVNELAAMGSLDDIATAIPKMLKRSERMQEDGIADTTMSGDEPAPQDDADDVDVEDADVDFEEEEDIEDAVEVDEDEDEDEGEEPEPEPEPKKKVTQQPQGLRRRRAAV